MPRQISVNFKPAVLAEIQAIAAIFDQGFAKTANQVMLAGLEAIKKQPINTESSNEQS